MHADTQQHTHTHMHACMHAHTHIYIYKHTHMHTKTCMHVCMHMHAHILTDMHTHKHTALLSIQTQMNHLQVPGPIFIQSFSEIANDFHKLAGGQRWCNKSSPTLYEYQKCFFVNFPFISFDFGLPQDDTIHYYFESEIVSPTEEQMYLRLLLDSNSQFILQAEVNDFEVFNYSDLGYDGFQKHIFTSQYNQLSLTLPPLGEQMLLLALFSDVEDGEKVS